jgi:predicted amidohydrolase YtcJ
MTTLLLRNARVHGAPGADTVVVANGRIVRIGRGDGGYDGAAEVHDLAGALLLPAFVDAHIHVVQTGFLLTQLDLRGATSLEDALAAVQRFAAGHDDDVLVGTGWDDSTWPERRPPTAAELDRAAPGRRMLLTRLDGHSAVLSPALMDAIDGLPAQHGYGAAGHMTLDAMQHTVAAVADLIGPAQRLEAARAAVDDLLHQGVAGFHEAAAPHIGPAYEVDLVRRAATECGLLPSFYWGELGAFDTAAELGALGVAGDLNADGSIGSRTAALHTAYDDRPGHSGHAYLDATQIADHVVACTERGVQGGFHCIGEAGLAAVTEGFRLAEKRLGAERIRRGRHRLEHVEMPDRDAIAMMADLGLVASMQPLFDELWGGPDQMYAERLGGRWRGMNPIGALHRAGVTVALGSDAPVTEPRPWAAIRAACRHHEEDQRVDAQTAFAMHTAGGWRAAGNDDAGTITEGAAAHLAAWDVAGDVVGDVAGDTGGNSSAAVLPGPEDEPRLRLLVVAGRTVTGADR